MIISNLNFEFLSVFIENYIKNSNHLPYTLTIIIYICINFNQQETMRKVKIIFILILFFVFSCRDEKPSYETGIVIDREGNVYKTVKIGQQWWMAENLRTGLMVKSDKPLTDNGIIEKYCYDDKEENCQKYGGLYTWDEMMNYSVQEGAQGICPDGWHIPSDKDVKELEKNLGMSKKQIDMDNAWRGTNQGKQMKEGGASGLHIPLAGGKQNNNYFFNIGQNGYFWTSTSIGSGAWRRSLEKSRRQVGRFNTYPKTYSLSVRCIKTAQ